MDYFLELTRMERIEIMRLALETLLKARRRPRNLGDIIRKVKDVADSYAISVVQEKKAPEPPQIRTGLLKPNRFSNLP
jgi:hypothetical protein